MTSTYDHRIIQGAESGRFLARIEEYLQGEHGFYEGVFASLGVELGPPPPPPAPAAAAAAAAHAGTTPSAACRRRERRAAAGGAGGEHAGQPRTAATDTWRRAWTRWTPSPRATRAWTRSRSA